MKTARGMPRAAEIANPDGNSGEGDRQSFATLRRIDDAHRHRLAFGEMVNAGGPEDRDVNEHILAAVIRLNEAEALVVVEPFDRSADFRRGRRIRMTARGTRLSEARRRRAFRQPQPCRLQARGSLARPSCRCRRRLSAWRLEARSHSPRFAKHRCAGRRRPSHCSIRQSQSLYRP